jgi:hypothetical protein
MKTQIILMAFLLDEPEKSYKEPVFVSFSAFVGDKQRIQKGVSELIGKLEGDYIILPWSDSGKTAKIREKTETSLYIEYQLVKKS